MSRAYVTGVAGFLGSHLADALLAQGDEVWGCDDLSTGDPANVGPRVRWQKRSIEDLTATDLAGIDTCYHVAAAAYEGASNFIPRFISRNIYAGSAAVFSAAIAAGVRRIVFTSSMARYGNNPSVAAADLIDLSSTRAFSEDMLPRPVDPYGIAKEAVERLLVNLCETHGIEWAIAVPHNIYGPRQRYVDPLRNVAAIFANLLLQHRQPFVYGDGHQVRCFSYVDDVVPSLVRLGYDPVGAGLVVNVGPDSGAVSILELGRLIGNLVGFPFDPVFLPPRPREVRHAVCSSQRARDVLGFESRTPLVEGLTRLVGWVRERGPRPFEYHLKLNEIESALMPRTWYTRAM